MSSFVSGYLDESGSLADKEKNFVVAVLICFDERRLARIMKKVRRKVKAVASQNNRGLTSELKFSNTSEKARRYILKTLGEEKAEIYVIILDKAQRKISDSPDNYALVVRELLKYGFDFHPKISLMMDIHYTLLNKREKVINILSHSKYWNKEDLKVSMIDSSKNKLLQLVDFAAGAYYYKYIHKDDKFAKIIEDRVKVEKVVKWTEIKKDS